LIAKIGNIYIFIIRILSAYLFHTMY